MGIRSTAAGHPLDWRKRSIIKDRLPGGSTVENNDKRLEFRSFIFLVVILAPILAVAVVGGYGFAVWMSQLLMGAPGV